MWYIIPIFIVIVGYLTACNIKQKDKHDDVIIIDGKKNDSLSSNITDTILPMYSKKNIEDKLKILAKTSPPKELAIGAMCYSVSMPPDNAQYICPSCGEKTLYKRDDYKNGIIIIDNCLQGIHQCRSGVEKIKGINIKLDESQFCKKCSTDIEEPQLCLLVNINNKKDTTKVCNINVKDINLINEFLHNEFKHKGSYDEELPLLN